MTEERLKEIKDSIDLQYDIARAKGYNKEALLFTDEQLELYNEVIRLKEIIDKINHIMNNQMNYREFVDVVNAIDDILKEKQYEDN